MQDITKDKEVFCVELFKLRRLFSWNFVESIVVCKINAKIQFKKQKDRGQKNGLCRIKLTGGLPYRSTKLSKKMANLIRI